MIDREGRGAVVYLNQEGRGIGLCNKIHAYKLQDEGLDTVDANLKLGFKADERDYGVGASIIRELGIRHMRLMTNNPLKRAGLEGYGLCIDEIVPIVIAPNPYNAHYLETKQERMHHTLGLEKKITHGRQRPSHRIHGHARIRRAVAAGARRGRLQRCGRGDFARQTRRTRTENTPERG